MRELTLPAFFFYERARAHERTHTHTHTLSLKQEHRERERRRHCRHGNGLDRDFLSIKFAMLEETKSVSGRYIRIYYMFLGYVIS